MALGADICSGLGVRSKIPPWQQGGYLWAQVSWVGRSQHLITPVKNQTSPFHLLFAPYGRVSGFDGWKDAADLFMATSHPLALIALLTLAVEPLSDLGRSSTVRCCSPNNFLEITGVVRFPSSTSELSSREGEGYLQISPLFFSPFFRSLFLLPLDLLTLEKKLQR